jgi:hypothetical protein
LTPAVQDTSTARSSCCRKRRSKPTKYVAVISGTGTARPQSESPQRQRFSWSFELDGPWRARGLSEPLAAVRCCAAPQLFSARRISDSVGAGGASTFAWEITPASHNATSRALDRGASSTVRWIRPALAIESTARSTGDAHPAAAHRTPKHRGDGPMMTGPELFDVWQLTRRPAEFHSEFMDSQFLSGGWV